MMTNRPRDISPSLLGVDAIRLVVNSPGVHPSKPQQTHNPKTMGCMNPGKSNTQMTGEIIAASGNNK